MIKYISRSSEIGNISARTIEKIKGYDVIKNVFQQQLQYLQNNMGGMDHIIPGFVLVGKKHHGKHFMVNIFLEAVRAEAFIISDRMLSKDIDALRSYIDQTDKDKVAMIVLDQIDQMKGDQVDNISQIVHASEKRIYILGISEEDGDMVKSCRSCGLIEYSIPVTDPFLKDSVEIIEDLIHNKYSWVKFDMSIEDMAAVVYSLPFCEVDRLVESSIRDSRSSNRKSVSEKCIIEAASRRYYCVNTVAEYQTKRKLTEACIHEVGHCIMAELLAVNSVGYAYVGLKQNVSPLGYTSVIREDSEYKASKDEIRVLLAGIAAEELCNSYISAGGGDDIKKVIDTLTSLAGNEACFGLEYIDHYNVRSGEQQDWYVKEIRQLMQKTYDDVKEALNPFKDIINEAAKIMCSKGYLLGRELRDIMKQCL